MSEPDAPPRNPHYPGPLIAFLLVFSAWMLTGFIAALGVREGKPPDIALIGVAQVIGFGGVAALAIRRVPGPHAERMGLRGFEARYWPLLFLLLPIVIVASEVDNLVQLVAPPSNPEAFEGLLAELREKTTPALVAQQALVSVGLVPVVQEWLFRGVVQQGAIAYLGLPGGLFFTAALFAIGMPFGGLPMSPAGAFAASLVLGLALGALRVATGSLVAPMLLHAACNAAGLALLLGSASMPIAGLNAPGDHTPAMLLWPAVAAVGVAAVTLRREMLRAVLVVPVAEEREDA